MKKYMIFTLDDNGCPLACNLLKSDDLDEIRLYKQNYLKRYPKAVVWIRDNITRHVVY